MARFWDGSRTAAVIGVWLAALLLTMACMVVLALRFSSEDLWNSVALGLMGAVFLVGCRRFVVVLKRRRLAFAHITANRRLYFSLVARLNDAMKRLVIIDEDGHNLFDFKPSDEFGYGRVAGQMSKRGVQRALVLVSDEHESVYNPETLRDDYYASVTMFRWYLPSSRVRKEQFLKQMAPKGEPDDDGTFRGEMHIKADGTESVDPKDVRRFGPIVVRFNGRRENRKDDAGLDVDTSAIDHYDYATCEDLEGLLRMLESQ
jgi:hypothetical protein